MLEEEELPFLTHSTLKEGQLTQDMINNGDFSPLIPDHVKLAIADLHLLWGKTETFIRKIGISRLKYWGSGSFDERVLRNRYSILKALIKEEKRTRRITADNVWILLRINKHMLTTIRDDVTHSWLFGVIHRPKLGILLQRINKNGAPFRRLYFFEEITKAVELLRLQNELLEHYHNALWTAATQQALLKE